MIDDIHGQKKELFLKIFGHNKKIKPEQGRTMSTKSVTLSVSGLIIKAVKSLPQDISYRPD